jgi:hypothetical protein
MQDSDTATPYLAKIDLTGDPHLVLGRRARKKGIETVQVELHADLHDLLRHTCELAIEKVQATDGRPYEPSAELESGEEHFFLHIDQIPVQVSVSVSGQNDDENPERTAALIEALGDFGSIEYIDRAGLRDFKPLFYSIAWQQSGGDWAHFIRKANPMQVLKPGRIWTQFSDVLVSMQEPAMAIDGEVDIILANGVMRAFKSTPVKDLFTDVHLVMRDVSTYVGRVRDLLNTSVPLGQAAAESLEKAAHKKYSIAVRLYLLPERISQLNLSVPRLRRVFNQHDLDQYELLGKDKTFSFGEDMVPAFLDVIEGRYFEDDWTDEFRRADRFSKRGNGEN